MVLGKQMSMFWRMRLDTYLSPHTKVNSKIVKKKKKIKLNNTQCVTSNVETARRKHRQCLLNIDTEKNLEELAEQASTYPGIKAKN